MIDTDLAALYETETKALKQQVKRNIDIMRAFAKYRSMLMENQDLRSEIRVIDDKINKVFKFLLEKIDALHQKKIEEKPRKRIGFKKYENE